MLGDREPDGLKLAGRRGDVTNVDRPQLTGLLVDDVCGCRRVVALLFKRADERAAALAVVRALRDDEPALWAVTGQGPCLRGD